MIAGHGSFTTRSKAQALSHLSGDLDKRGPQSGEPGYDLRVCLFGPVAATLAWNDGFFEPHGLL